MVVLGFVLALSVRGQMTANILYPDLYTLYEPNLYLINAAYVPHDTHTDLSAFYKFQTGAFKEVATLTCSAAKLFDANNEGIHSIRLNVLNEKQGPYISSPRANVNYAYELPLGSKTRLGAGLATGFAGMSYTGVSTTGSVNSYLPDASAGLIFKYRELHLGIAGLQLFNAKTKPFTSQIELPRYYHFHLEHQLQLAENVKWKYYALYRALPEIKNELLVGMQVLFSEAFGVGAIVRSNAGLSIYAELALDSEKDRLKILVNYNSSFFELVPKFQDSMEIGIGYVLK